MSAITVGYWSIRGLGACLRMMVMYAGETLQADCYDVAFDAEVYVPQVVVTCARSSGTSRIAFHYRYLTLYYIT
jgi:hypothetical protein